MFSDRAICEILILCGTFLYGVSIVTSRGAMELGLGPFTFNALQHIVATAFLFCTRSRFKRLTETPGQLDNETPESTIITYLRGWFPSQISESSYFELILLSIMCAVPNFIGSTCSQVGLVTVEAGKSAFLTSTYVIFTPIIQHFLPGSGDQMNTLTWLAAGISLLGSYFLAGCSENSFADSLSFGELLTLFGAVMWALSILAIDYSVDRVSGIDISCFEMAVSSVLCIAAAMIMEPDGLSTILPAFQTPVNYSALGCLGIIAATGILEAFAFVLDTLGQMNTSGSRAALLMGLDSLVTVVIAYIFLGEVLSKPELFGCALLLISTLVATSASEDGEDGWDDPRRIRSSAEFAGELRKQRFLLLSRHTVPMRRMRSHSLSREDMHLPRPQGEVMLSYLNSKPHSFHGDEEVPLNPAAHLLDTTSTYYPQSPHLGYSHGVAEVRAKILTGQQQGTPAEIVPIISYGSITDAENK